MGRAGASSRGHQGTGATAARPHLCGADERQSTHGRHGEGSCILAVSLHVVSTSTRCVRLRPKTRPAQSPSLASRGGRRLDVVSHGGARLLAQLQEPGRGGNRSEAGPHHLPYHPDPHAQRVALVAVPGGSHPGHACEWIPRDMPVGVAHASTDGPRGTRATPPVVRPDSQADPPPSGWQATSSRVGVSAYPVAPNRAVTQVAAMRRTPWSATSPLPAARRTPPHLERVFDDEVPSLP